MGKTAAFFDFDGTLIAGDSYREFLKYNLKQNFRLIISVKIFWTLLLRKLRIISLKEAKEQILNHLEIRDFDSLKIIGSKFAREILEPLLLKEALDRMQWHKRQNHTIVLVSSAPNIYFDFLKDKIRLDIILASSVECREGKYLITEHCFGNKKLEKIKELTVSEDLQLSLSYAYSDHQSDLAMLESVKNPYAVSPTKKLRKYAEKESWPILKW